MTDRRPGDAADVTAMFRFMNEVAIIAQLSGAAFEKVMPGTMTLPQFIVLNHLTRVGDNRTPLQLARAMQVTKGAMTNTIGHLERSHWIAVRPDDTDGRSKRVSITEAGRSAHRDAVAAVEPELAWLCGIVAPAAIRDILPMLETLRQALDRRRDG